MSIERHFTIGLNAGYSIAPVIHVNQYDHNEVWYFTLMNENGEIYTPTTGGIVGVKSDGNAIVNSGTVDSNGRVVINETQQMTAAAGNAVFELILDSSAHGTANFVVQVEAKPGDNASLSDSDISLIEQAIVLGNRIVTYGSPLTASTAAQMTDHEKVYVYTGSESGYTNGHWYYWNGSAWTDGGVYNAVAINTDKTLSVENMAADGKATGDAIADLKNALNFINNEGGQTLATTTWTSGKYLNKSTNQVTNGSAQLYLSEYISIPQVALSKIIINNIVSFSGAWTVGFFNHDKQFISGISSLDGQRMLPIETIPQNAYYILVTHFDYNNSFPVINVSITFENFSRLINIENGVSVLSNNLVLNDAYNNVLQGATTFTDNTFINQNGYTTTNPNFCLIDGYYEVKPNVTYKLYRGEPPLYSNAGHNWTWWDENKVFISYVLSAQPQTAPENAKYLRLGIYISNTGSATHETFDPTNVIVTEDGNPCFEDKFTDSFVPRPTFQGMKWIGIGDSITEENFRATWHYHDYIKAETGLTFVNMGVSGTGYKAEGSGDKAFYKRVPDMATDADVITIFGGVNDVVLSNATIGTGTDTGTDTICGCVNTTLDAIESLYPAHMPIGIISPLPCACVDTTVNLHPLQNPNDDTCRMAQFVDQLALICKHRGIPFLDLFHQSNLRPWKAECREKYFSCDVAPNGDGLHPNGHGHRLFYRQIMDFVQRIVMR